MQEKVLAAIEEHLAVFQSLKSELIPLVIQTGQLLFDTLNRGGKLLIAGNGGSAADAQHFAAEIVGRYLRERQALAAIALTTDTSILTAVGNDYGYDHVFSRQVEGLARSGDVFIGISTSGNSPNVVKAIESANSMDVHTIALVGKSGGKMAELANTTVLVPSSQTPRIQEAQLWIYHTWCEIIDELYP